MFSRKPKEMVTSDTAIEGRSEAVHIDPRHFINTTSMLPPFPEGAESITFAMGCFWGAERIFWSIPGVLTTAAGYQGGFTENPTYEEVCTGKTGHTEAVLVVYDPETVDADSLLKRFWEQHDPTQLNGQGNDVGTQYRSAVYWTTEDQHDAIVASKNAYESSLAKAGFGSVTTELRPADEAGPFYYAEQYHQQYLAKNSGGYCNHGFCQVAYEPTSPAIEGTT